MTATTPADAAGTMDAAATEPRPNTSRTSDLEKETYIIPRFGALCFFLATVECVIPKPLPFLRLGLANIPLVLAAGVFPARAFFLLAAVKIFAQGIAGGTFFSWLFLFSAAGTLASAAVMFLLKKALKSAVSAVGLSVAGATASTAAQLLTARAWIFGESVSALAPALLIAGIASGFCIGLASEIFARRSAWFADIRQLLQNPAAEAPQRESPQPENAETKTERERRIRAKLLFFSGLAAAICAGIFSHPAVRGAICLSAFLFLCAAKKRPRILPAALTLLAITAFNLYPPHGEVLFSAGALQITDGALLSGLSRALLFESLLFISRLAFLDFSALAPRRLNRLRIFSLAEQTLALFGKLNASAEEASAKAKAEPKAKTDTEKQNARGIRRLADSLVESVDKALRKLDG